jgi:predicted transcriptional regulator
MKTNTDSVGPLEREVLDLIWTKHCSTVREVCLELQQKKSIAYTTAMTIMNRLVEKNILSRKKVGKHYTYCPKKTRKQFLHNLVKNTLSYFATNYGEEAISAFFHQTHNLNDKDRKEIIKILKKS